MEVTCSGVEKCTYSTYPCTAQQNNNITSPPVMNYLASNHMYIHTENLAQQFRKEEQERNPR
jgi:hypothetical protein